MNNEYYDKNDEKAKNDMVKKLCCAVAQNMTHIRHNNEFAEVVFIALLGEDNEVSKSLHKLSDVAEKVYETIVAYKISHFPSENESSESEEETTNKEEN